MGRPAILAIDQGTTNTRAVLVSPTGGTLGVGSVATGMSFPRPDWAEQSAAAIATSTGEAIRAALAHALDADIQAIGISNQRETVAGWDARTGAPVGPCINWQCLRSAQFCASLRAEGHEALVHQRTGLGLEPMFSAGKMRWLLDNVPGAADLASAGHLRLGTIDAWLLWQLTGGAVHATDPSNASRTLLFSLNSGDWDADMLRLFGIPASTLPAIMPSNALFGRTSGGFAGLPDGVPIHAMMGDSHAAMFAHFAASGANAKVTIGTGSSVMGLSDGRPHSSHGLSETVAWGDEAGLRHALEGNITVSGHAAAFAHDALGLPAPEAIAACALSVPDNGGVVFVPALAGLGAPHWKPAARGMLTGLSLATRPGHIARATLEGIAHQICDVLAAMEADGAPIAAIATDGGGAGNDLLLQTIADYSGRTITRPQELGLSAIGAAMMAARSIGHELPASILGTSDRFDPAISTDFRAAARQNWAQAIHLAQQTPESGATRTER